MKPYKRAEQHRKDLHSIKFYTKNEADESEERIRNCRPPERRTLLRNRNDDGERGRQSGRNGSETGSAENEYKFGDSRENSSYHGFSGQDGRELRAQSHPENLEVALFSKSAQALEEPA